MFYKLTIYFLIITSTSFSQSKKEQIEILTLRLDSLNRIINTERSFSSEKSIKINELNRNNKILENQIDEQSRIILKLTNELETTQSESSKMQKQLNINLQEIADLQNQIKSSKDSLFFALSELQKLNPKIAEPKKNEIIEINSNSRYSEDQLIEVDGLKVIKETGNILCGIVYHNFNSGKLLYEISYKNGLVNGWEKWYHWDGKLTKKGINVQKNPKGEWEKNGLWQEFYDTGEKKFEGNFKDDLPIGIHKYYHQNGRISRKTEYKNGIRFENRCFDENGDEIKPCEWISTFD
jgi:antitoxin component YwqK of YwqJK toxin-antitoxin module